jgi:hypothetical protein
MPASGIVNLFALMQDQDKERRSRLCFRTVRQNLGLSFTSTSYSKPARNSGRDAPPSFIDDLLDVSDRAVLAIVIQKEHLIEPHTSDNKGAGARQAFRGAGFEVTGLKEALEEQLDGFAPIGIQVVLPRLRVGGQLLGGEQPAAVLRIGGHEGGPTKGRVAQQQFRDREVLSGQGVFQPGALCPSGERG